MITAFRDIQKIIKETQQPEDEINELDFCSIKIFQFTLNIKSIIEKCQNLMILRLSECELNTLDKLPKLDILSLDLSVNKLKDAELEHLGKYPNLSILNLSENFISSISSFNYLKKCTQLKDLELSGNEVQKAPNYRSQAFKQLKSLELLDKLNENGQQPVCDSYSDDIVSADDDFDDSYEEVSVFGRLQDGEFDEDDSYSQSSEVNVKRKYNKMQDEPKA